MPSAKDEVARRPSSRPDPRADPDSGPPQPVTGRPPAKGKDAQGGLREEIAPRARSVHPRCGSHSIRGARVAPAPARLPREMGGGDGVGGGSDQDEDVPVDVTEEAPLAATVSEAPPPPADPRFAEIERLLDRTAWKEIGDKLGSGDAQAAARAGVDLRARAARGRGRR